MTKRRKESGERRLKMNFLSKLEGFVFYLEFRLIPFKDLEHGN
jgi:hypothetical protein